MKEEQSSQQQGVWATVGRSSAPGPHWGWAAGSPCLTLPLQQAAGTHLWVISMPHRRHERRYTHHVTLAPDQVVNSPLHRGNSTVNSDRELDRLLPGVGYLHYSAQRRAAVVSNRRTSWAAFCSTTMGSPQRSRVSPCGLASPTSTRRGTPPGSITHSP